MGRHADTAGSPRDLRRIAQASGLLGGIAWVVGYFLPDDPRPSYATVLLWLGGALLSVALVGLGLRLVRSDFLLLRVFVALALPTLVWGVFVIIRDSASNPRLVDAAFGAVVAVISAVELGRRLSRRATL